MEKNRINFAKLQLLRYVDELFVAICSLTAPNIEEDMNMSTHGLDDKELTIILYHLFSEYFLVALHKNRGLFTPTLDELNKALIEPRDSVSEHTFYGMTTAAHELYKELKSTYDIQK